MAAFDPIRYKQTTREQWQTAAAAWHRWCPLLSDWLDPATEMMLNMAGVGAGHRVLDVAAGAGGQTLVAARHVGASGFVLATDISANILEFAAEEARRQGLTNIATHVADGEDLDVEPRSNREAGAAIVYSTADVNGFFSLPVSIIRRRAQLAPPAPGQPGPFSLGERMRSF